MASKIFSRNDNAHPEVVIPVVFLFIFASVVITGQGIVLALVGGQETALNVHIILSAIAWSGLVFFGHRYKNVRFQNAE